MSIEVLYNGEAKLLGSKEFPSYSASVFLGDASKSGTLRYTISVLRSNKATEIKYSLDNGQQTTLYPDRINFIIANPAPGLVEIRPRSEAIGLPLFGLVTEPQVTFTLRDGSPTEQYPGIGCEARTGCRNVQVAYHLSGVIFAGQLSSAGSTLRVMTPGRTIAEWKWDRLESGFPVNITMDEYRQWGRAGPPIAHASLKLKSIRTTTQEPSRDALLVGREAVVMKNGVGYGYNKADPRTPEEQYLASEKQISTVKSVAKSVTPDQSLAKYGVISFVGLCVIAVLAVLWKRRNAGHSKL